MYEHDDVLVGAGKGGLSIGDKKYVCNGTFSLSYSRGTEHGHEIQFQLWGIDYQIVDRIHKKWDRLEIYMPIDKLDEIIEGLQNLRALKPEMNSGLGGGKSLKRSWSAEEIEKQLKKAEKPKGKSLTKVFKKDEKAPDK